MAINSLNLGTQIILDLYSCNKDRLNSLEFTKKIMLEAAEIARATVIQNNFHRFEPQGVSGVVVIAESHFAIHTWPEHGYAAIDLFTCNKDLFIDKAIDFLHQKFEAENNRVTRIERG